MRDRWDDEEENELGRGAGHRRGALDREPTLAETIDGAVRKIVTSVVLAGGLIALGIYSSGSDASVDYQIATTPDGKVYRLNSENGRILACQGQHCWRLPTGSDHLKDGPPAQAAPAAQPVQQQPEPARVAPGQPAPQLPAPENRPAPAQR